MIKVVDPEEIPDDTVAVCMPVRMGRFVVPGSTEEQCSRCGEAIWVAPSTPARLTKACLPCAMKETETIQ